MLLSATFYPLKLPYTFCIVSVGDPLTKDHIDDIFFGPAGDHHLSLQWGRHNEIITRRVLFDIMYTEAH